jgi:hypothetical protein
MRSSRRNLTQLIALGAAAGVIGIPIALITRTWTPLETPRRDTGTTPGESDADPDARQGDRGTDQDGRRREPKAKTSRRGNSESGSSTPEP